MLLNLTVNAQIVFLNNPSNHIVAYNPSFSAIKPYLNTNYVPNQLCVSSRISKNQSDVLATGQYFFEKRNIGISAHYNYVNQDKYQFQKSGIGLSYQLIFFNAISTGWGLSINYNNLQVDSNINAHIYNDKRNGLLQSSKYASLNFGGLINYDRIMLGFSVQPSQCIYFTSAKKGSFYTIGSISLKYKQPVTRNINATLWYNANWNSVFNLQFINADITKDKVQSHSFNLHLSGKKGFIAGLGCRLTNFNYTSLIAKAGYNAKHWQMVYGAEPYWLHTTYSEIIHELSFTFKFN